MREKLITVIGVIILTGFSFAAFTNIRNTNNKIKFKEIEVKSQEVKLKQLNQEYDKVLETKTKTEEEKQQQSDKIHQLEQEKLKLEEQLSAKLKKQEEARLAKARLDKEAKQVAGVSTAAAIDKDSVMRQAGISDTYHANLVINKESGWRASVVNGINCVGLIQACPKGLKPRLIAECPNWRNDTLCQLRVAESYATARYGSWANAWQFHIRNNWF